MSVGVLCRFISAEVWQLVSWTLLHSISQHAERQTPYLLACLNLPRSNSPKRRHQQCQTLRRLLLGPDSVFITWQHCLVIEEQSRHRSRCCEFWWTSVQPCWYLCTRVLAGLQPTINDYKCIFSGVKNEGHAEAVLQKSGSRTVVVGIADSSLRVDKQYIFIYIWII